MHRIFVCAAHLATRDAVLDAITHRDRAVALNTAVIEVLRSTYDIRNHHSLLISLKSWVFCCSCMLKHPLGHQSANSGSHALDDGLAR
jgi:hypothetical protein